MSASLIRLADFGGPLHFRLSIAPDAAQGLFFAVALLMSLLPIKVCDQTYCVDLVVATIYLNVF